MSAYRNNRHTMSPRGLCGHFNCQLTSRYNFLSERKAVYRNDAAPDTQLAKFYQLVISRRAECLPFDGGMGAQEVEWGNREKERIIKQTNLQSNQGYDEHVPNAPLTKKQREICIF